MSNVNVLQEQTCTDLGSANDSQFQHLANLTFWIEAELGINATTQSPMFQSAPDKLP